MNSREGFESWMTAEQWFHGSDFEWDDRRNCYSQFGIHLAYKAWLAAISAMEAKYAALAAECASTQAYLRNGPVINKGGELLAAHQFAPATPAIDAFLREVKAQGVEMFSEQQRSFIGKPSKNDAASSYCSREAIKFADQLRQGGAA